jgi:hypothetical protein
MRKFSQINENLETYRLKEKADKIIKVVEEKIKDSFYRGIPKIELSISSINGVYHKHYYLRVEIKDIMTASEWDRIGKRLIPKVQEIFNRIDDQNLDPLLSGSESQVDGEAVMVLSFGEIDFENSNIVKSLKTSNKYDL